MNADRIELSGVPVSGSSVEGVDEATRFRQTLHSQRQSPKVGRQSERARERERKKERESDRERRLRDSTSSSFVQAGVLRRGDSSERRRRSLSSPERSLAMAALSAVSTHSIPEIDDHT